MKPSSSMPASISCSATSSPPSATAPGSDLSVTLQRVEPSPPRFPVRRSRLPAVSGREQSRTSLWSVLKGSVGKSLTRLSIPVHFNEPLSFLQRLAEYMEHSGLIEKALHEVDCPVGRMELVGAFAASTLANVRSTKPFNPMLHESYELTETGAADGLGFHFIAEQVSHHPPISALHATSIRSSDNAAPTSGNASVNRPSWEFYGTVAPDLKFTGTRIECKPNAHFTLRLRFGSVRDGGSSEEVYTWQAISCLIHNLISGQLFTSLVGSLRVKCAQSGLMLELHFRGKRGERADLFASGVISEGRGGSDGKVRRVLYGNWASYLASSPAASTPKEREAALAELERIFRRCADNDELEAPVVVFHNHRLLWRASARPEHSQLSYNFPHFTLSLNAAPPAEAKDSGRLPATDSRCRQDIRLLEEGQLEKAGKEKLRLEEEQRAREKKRLREKRSLTPPRWFKALSGSDEFGRHGQYTLLPTAEQRS